MFNLVNAADAYSSARRAVAPAAQSGPDIAGAANNFEQAMAAADQTATQAMRGETQTHVLVQSIAEAELALETVVAMRDRVVEAYQEILRMPV